MNGFLDNFSIIVLGHFDFWIIFGSFLDVLVIFVYFLLILDFLVLFGQFWDCWVILRLEQP